MTIKSMALFATCLLTTISTNSYAQQEMTTADVDKLNKIESGSVISIHDPSVVLKDGEYTIWGSHLGVAKSSDLVNWTPMDGQNVFIKLNKQGAENGTACSFADAFNIQQVTTVKNCNGEIVEFPNIDAEAYCNRYAAEKETWINGNMWAPDIIYNKEMQKWCMYLSCNGDHWSSIIILLTADSSTGPFTYQGPVVMGGFHGATYDGVAPVQIEETDYTIATGETTLPARYLQKTANGEYWPNCIDPCVFYDEEGDLWMSYGSWSGGIFILKLDKETGLRDYTYKYASDYDTKGRSGLSDPYFGKKIAGGYYVSGEGSYIQHIGNYYYLFMSYGFYDPVGGYEMRIFRSEKPDGPYVDGNGAVATYTQYQMNYGPNAKTNRGMKLMGAYNNWGELQNVGECAQGHNSACVDDKGRAFVVYHTKFNDGTYGHQVRVHQLFINSNGWPVASPFCYRGEEASVEDIQSKQSWSKDELTGDYHLLLHKYKMDYESHEEVTPADIRLEEDGTVTGDKTGTWSITEGTGYITLKLANTTYDGVVCLQSMNGATKQNYKVNGHQAIAFTVTSKSGVPVWGYKLEPRSAISVNVSLIPNVSRSVKEDIDLNFSTIENVTYSWSSNIEGLITEDNVLMVPRDDSKISANVTCQLKCGDYFYNKLYSSRNIQGNNTGIEEITNENKSLQSIYDLTGRKVSKPSHGVYIINARKEVVR